MLVSKPTIRPILRPNPYDNPVATPYPSAIVSPGGPVITPEPAPKSADTRTLTDAERMPPESKRDATSKANGTRRDLTKLFQLRDQNKDGIVTLEEFIGDPKNRNVHALTKRFKQLDSNKDEELSLDELEQVTR